MVDAFCDSYTSKPDAFVKLLSDAEKPLYGGCVKFSILSSLVRLYNLKAKHSWTDSNFSELQSLVHELLPGGTLCRLQCMMLRKHLAHLAWGIPKSMLVPTIVSCTGVSMSKLFPAPVVVSLGGRL